ncbi:MAG TPA: PQQ-binding-like beta-propeller repeat protein [Hanamia sp.]|nr:PQQ-binding-like beta-propeller repeat protein [Hanamia sp.]
MKKNLLLICLIFSLQFSFAQSTFKFAHVSDTHIGSHNAEEDLRRTVENINKDSSLKFVIISGDITDFGSDSEFHLAKQILDSLNKPWHIIPGNHDANWSESGTNSFKKIFGAETFDFKYGGYLFLGTVCGPNMRMSPGQVSRENIVWLDSTLSHLKDKNIPIIYVNHYPQDSSLNNWYEVIDLLKTRNTQLILCGHGHANRQLNFEGIPGIMGRSNLRAKNAIGGYNVLTIKDGTVTYEERNPVTNEEKEWAQVKLYKHDFAADTNHYFRPSYAVNKIYQNVKSVWQFNDKSDIGSGVALAKNLVIASNSNGLIYALDLKTGKKKWSYATKGKIYSTPAVENNLAVVASTDDNIYCINANSGKLIWKFETQKPIVANPLIKNGIVYIGAADGHFRALDLKTGKLKWDYFGVKGFVVTKPLFYNNKIYFGSWGTEFYALNAETGALAWKWNNGSANRMFSPAACYPVATDGKIFIVAPDRYMTVFDAETGKVIWRKNDSKNHVRESMGLSADSSLVYAKTMEGELIGISTSLPDMQIIWEAHTGLNYEIAPTAIVENENIIYVPSNSGMVVAVNRDGSILWKHKISNALVTNITPVSKKKIIATTMDGKVTCLEF